MKQAFTMWEAGQQEKTSSVYLKQLRLMLPLSTRSFS